MNRCAAECTIDLDTEDYMKCTRCKDAYHYICLNLSSTEIACLDQDSKHNWSCPRCCSKQPKGGNINLPVRPSTPTSTADITFNVTRRKTQLRPEPLQMTTSQSDFVLRTELRELIREEMRNVVKECITELNTTLKENLQVMREQICSFKESLSFLSDQYDNLHKTVEETRSGLLSLSKENESLRSDNVRLSNKLSVLDQVSRASNLEILCVPESKSENVISIVKQLGRAVNCNINDNEILHCSRTAKMNPTNTRPRSILVKLNSPRTRDTLLSAVVAHNKRHAQDKLNTSDLGFGTGKSPVYVVENLSPENKSLHAAARQRCKQLQYKFVWVRGGRIYVRKSETTHTVLISNLDVLNKLV